MDAPDWLDHHRQPEPWRVPSPAAAEDVPGSAARPGSEACSGGAAPSLPLPCTVAPQPTPPRAGRAPVRSSTDPVTDAGGRSRLPFEAHLVALASLNGMGPARLSAICARWPAGDAWAAVTLRAVLSEPTVVAVLGRDPRGVAEAWAAEASTFDVAARWKAHAEAGIGVTALGSPGYPVVLAADLEPPPLLFHLGDPDRIGGSRVAVVGTRRCTRLGLDVARDLGHDLTVAGVQVVSGLALGIDGAAHQGALDGLAGGRGAPPVAVVASGLDEVYPRRHAPLFARVAAAGVVLSEAPLGVPPARWRFPARNRIVAALADIVLVVESPATGGSMYTVTEAVRRGRGLMAVPGSVRSAASTGTNQMLADGATPVRDADDVVIALGLAGASTAHRTRHDPRPPPTATAAAVLEAVGWQPVSVEQLCDRADVPLTDLAAALARLAGDGWIDQRGGWIERVARPEAHP